MVVRAYLQELRSAEHLPDRVVTVESLGRAFLEVAAGGGATPFRHLISSQPRKRSWPTAEAKGQRRVQLAALPADEYPITSAEAGELVEWMGGRIAFDHGLELILDGLESRLPVA